MKNFKKLKNLTIFSSNKEKEVREQWVNAQAEHDYFLKQQIKIDEYIKHYSQKSIQKLPVSLLINHIRILEQIKCARELKKEDTIKVENKKNELFYLWMSQYKKKICFEFLLKKYTKKKRKRMAMHEIKRTNDLCIFNKKNIEKQ